MVHQEIGRWRKEKAIVKQVHQKESMVEAGQSTIGNGSRVNFSKIFRLLQESFSIFSLFYLDASKQYRDQLGVGFVLKT
jgi:hypothetical protein